MGNGRLRTDFTQVNMGKKERAKVLVLKFEANQMAWEIQMGDK